MFQRPRHAVRRRPIRALAGVAAVAVLASVVLVAMPAQAVVWSPFTRIYSQNAHGNIAIVGNTVMSCTTGSTVTANNVTTTCDQARAHTQAPWVNNSWNSQYVDVDGKAGTFNSSSSTLTLPSDGAVLYAELVWGGRMPNGSATAGANQSLRGNVRFTTPDGVDHALAGAVENAPAATNPNPYQGSIDVTSLVANAGSGSYTVANVQTAVGTTDQYGGWALVVAYSDPNAVQRNLTIYRGFANISNQAGSQTQDLTFDGFITPPLGQVKTEVGFVTYEGDRGNNDGYRGDSVDLKGSKSATATPITNSLNPADDVFNSTITTDDVDLGTRTPNYANQLGFDADVINADGVLQNNETSATITLKTGGETYYPGIVTFASQLYDPQLNGTKSVALVDANSNNQADFGERLDYSVSIQNDGLDVAKNSTFFDAIPTGTTYVPGSLRIDGAVATDQPSDDPGEYSSTPIGHVVARFGSGANTARGGSVDPQISTPSDKHTVAFSVTIGAPSVAIAGQRITNAASLSYVGATSGAAGASVSNVTISILPNGPASTLQAPNRTLSFDPTPGTPALAIDLNGKVTGGTAPYTLIATTDPAGGTVVDNGNGTVSYTPRNTFAGRDVFTYTVQDSTGARSTGTVKIDVLNDAPVAVNDTPTVSHSSPTTIDPTLNDTDANGDPITVYSVSGNGSTASEGQPAITLASGGKIAVVGGKVRYTPPASAAVGATDTFTYLAQDSRGFRAANPATVTVTLANGQPTAANDTLETQKNASTAVTIDPRTNDSDPDGDTLSITGVGGAAHGTTSFTGTSVSYTPNAGYAGSDSFSYTISDGFGGTATATVNVKVDGGPTAVADTFTAPGGSTSVSGNVITDPSTGDTDPNGDPLSLVSVGNPASGTTLSRNASGSVTLTVPQYYVGTQTLPYRITDGTYPDDSTVTFVVQNVAPTASASTATIPATTGGVLDVFGQVTDPNVTAGFQQFTLQSATATNGATVTDNGDGTVTVVPAAGNKNPVTLTYTVSDGVTTVSSSIAIAVEDNAPTATPNTASIPTNGTADVDVITDDSDVDGDALTLTGVTAPLDGGTQRGTSSVVAGRVHYVPPTGYTGTVTMTYTVSDGTKSSTATLTITVDNAAPLAQNDAIDVNRTGSTPLPVTGNDTDANGDAITVASVTANGQTITSGSITTAAGGTLTLTNGVLVYTAPQGGLAPGDTETFGYTAEDPRGGQSATAGSVTLTAVNRAPVAVADTLSVLKNSGPTAFDPRTGDSDPDGDALTVTTAGPAAHGTVTLSNGTLTYTPATGYAGSDSFSYTVSDGNAGTASATVTVKVDGAPAAVPVSYSASGSASAVVISGNLITDGPITDPNGDAVTLAAVTAPAAAEGSRTFSSGGNVAYTAPAGFVGSVQLTYTVTDGTSSSTSTVTFTVNNVAPTATAGNASISSGSGGTVGVQGQVTDPNVTNGFQQLTTTAASASDNATATIQPDGSVRIVPASGFTGPLTLTYTVSDGVASVTSTVTVNVVNGSAPVAEPETIHTPTDTVLDAAVTSNDSDPNGDTVSLKSVGTPVDAQNATTGTAAIVAGKVRYTPPTGFAGTVTVPYTVTDGSFDASTTLTVIVDNAAPVANADAATAADYRTVTTTDVLGNDSDANIPGTSQALSIASATADHGAAVQIVGGSLRVTPAAGYRGPVAVDYVVSDGAGGTATGRLTVTVGNSPATVTSPRVGSTGGPVTVDLLGTSTDPDGDTLAVGSVGPALGADGRQHGTVTRSGSRITITPDPGYLGTLSVSYTVTDGGGGTSSGTVTVNVTRPAATSARAARGGPGTLATTGIGPAPLLLVLGLLLGAGAALLEAERRRRLRPDPRHLA